MGWSKKEFIIRAFEEIGLASYLYDLTPDELNSVAKKLEAMMASWIAKGVNFGYPISFDINNIDLNAQTLVPEIANEAIYLNLATRIAPSFGKTLSLETKANAADAYRSVLAYISKPCMLPVDPSLPIGAGYKPYYRNFFYNKYNALPNEVADVEF